MSKEAIFKSVFATTLGVAALLCGALIYFGYQAYTSPSQVYGSWVEINAPGYRTEVLTLSDQGVFRNHRLISTSFEYDGKNIKIETGQGRSVYALAGTESSPQLKRIHPASPIQRFIKQGYEATVDSSGGAETRRSAITSHFDQN